MIDLNSVKRLNVYVDGILDGSLSGPLNPNFLFLRLDVRDKYPWLPNPYNVYNGFRYYLDTSKYVDGIHQIVLETVDYLEFTNYWVQRPLVFNNHN